LIANWLACALVGYLGRLDAGDFFADQGYLGMDGLARLLKFARYLRWSLTTGEAAANLFLLLGQADGWMIQSRFCNIF